MAAVGDGEGAGVADMGVDALSCGPDEDLTVGAGSCGEACGASSRHAESVTRRTVRHRIGRAALKWVSLVTMAIYEYPIACLAATKSTADALWRISGSSADVISSLES